MRYLVGKIEYKFTNGNSLLHNYRNSSMANKRRFDDSYIRFGFTLINDRVVEKGQCVVCATARYAMVIETK